MEYLAAIPKNKSLQHSSSLLPFYSPFPENSEGSRKKGEGRGKGEKRGGKPYKSVTAMTKCEKTSSMTREKNERIE